MSRVAINTGSVANDGTGDSLRIAGGIINDNFSEIYSQFGDGTNLTPTWDKTAAGINTTSSVGIGTTNPRFTLEVGAVGASGTSLWVNGNARVTGILTVGSSSIVLDGNANKILVGSGISFDGNTGIISATAFYAGGSIISGGGSGGGLNYWGSSASGISTTANVAIGTVTPTSKLTVVGNSLFSGIATFRSNLTLANLTSSSNTLRFGSNSYIDQSNSDVVTFQITSGTDGSGTDSSFVFRTTEPGVSPVPDQAYDALRVYSGGDYWNRLVRVYTNFHADNDAFVGGDLQVGAASTLIGVGSTLGSFKVGAGGTVITTTTAGLVGIGTTNPTSALTVTGNALVTGIATITGVATINGINISAGNNDSNTGVGKESLLSVSGQENTAFGRSALFSTLGGQSNTGIGYQALYTSAGTTPDSSYNTALGWKAMRLNTTGSQNVAVGGQALESNLSGFGNVALGQGANNANTTANYNTSVGWAALAANTTGSYNIAIGFYAGWIGPISGNHNVLIGPVEINNSSSPTAAPPIAGGSNQLVIGAGSTAWIYGNSSYNIGIGTTNPTSALTVKGNTSLETLNVSGISTLGTVQISSGIVTATSGIVTYFGDTSNTTDGRWTLGANGTSDYTFTGIGFTQTTNDPVLYLARGRVYEFVNNSGGSHPFQIRVSNGGAAYSDGVTNNSAASGVIRFEVPFNAPNTLYYQCTVHSGMGNTISVYPNTI